ncbi:AAA-like domain-containing protein [Nostoc sp. FACHB-133]|uniref:AAA-like domain-containing protein n=1 Tax=Nostoc sp. FACHB-133 TaxID=2692835 RepID=UPI001683D6A1|nr:AAA-like domain-containing protein [Nostoc sp. FACHB-133]MBD2527267.1 AAA-like domain-containing protein [Nostoc sp. FACHB-133]
MSNGTVKTILILAANPKNSTPLRLDEEVREIDAGLMRARNREQFELEQKWATRPRDVQRAMLDINPQIVHFSGHGVGNGGLALEDETGNTKLVSTKALAGLFELFVEQVECVLLNACYSEIQAEAIAQHIPYVIGMSQAVGDKAALEFAVGFYDALGAGKSIEFAYKFACNSICMAGIAEDLTPVLKKKTNVLSDNRRPQERESQELDNSTRLLPNSIVLEEPEGQVGLDSAFYVERPPIESDCYERLVKPGALIRIKAPRQMGKSSLMERTLHYATQQGYLTASLNFQSTDRALLTNLDEFLQWFCTSIARRLNIPEKLDKYWQGRLGSKDKCTNYFERYLLPEIPGPLALALDEVDELFQYRQVAADFFGLLRFWHEEAKNEPLWKKLRLIVVHSREVYVPLNINQSPFNVGLAIELPEMTQAQVQEWVQRHGLQWTTKQVEELMQMVGGHPYLVRVALYQIARGRITLEQLLKDAPTEEGLYGDHLSRHLLNIEEDADLVLAITKVVAASEPVKIERTQGFKLRSMGLVKFQGNAVMPLCNLYRCYFRDRLGIS